MKKRILALLLAVVTLFCFVSCDTKPAGDASSEELKGPYPVIIIPGIIGSELMKDDRRIWLNDLDGFDISAVQDFLSLAVPEDGRSDGSITPVRFCMADYEGGNIGTWDIYGDLAESLAEELGDDCVYFFGYDWRLDNRDTAEELASYIDTVLENTGAEKVNIVAHSMGGFVTSAYLSAHKNDGLVDRVVTCGTPFLGAEGATVTLEDGTGLLDFSEYTGEFTPLIAALFRTLPALYQLVPSSGYTQLGLLNEDGTIKDDASAAAKIGYEYNTQIMANLVDIWKDVDHYNIVGGNHDTTGEDGNMESGDGTVTCYSATANGEFAKDNHKLCLLSLNHNDLVTDYEAIEAILYAVGSEAYGK